MSTTTRVTTTRILDTDEAYGEYDRDAIANEYRDAIQALLPPWGRRFVKQAGPNAAMTAWSAGAASKS